MATDLYAAERLRRALRDCHAERDRLAEENAAKDDRLDGISTDVRGQAADDALAYVEMRAELLGTDDPLAVLAAIVEEVRVRTLAREEGSGGG